MNENFKESFEKTRLAGIIAAGALDEVAKIAIPGTRTDEIDKLCYEFLNDHGAYSAPLFYRGFPKSCCTSTNHVVCHGIPSSDKILKEGDIVVAEGLKKVRPFGKIKPLKDGEKQNKGDWKKKAKSNNTETKKSKFDWIKKLNIFKKSESQKKEEKNK